MIGPFSALLLWGSAASFSTTSSRWGYYYNTEHHHHHQHQHQHRRRRVVVAGGGGGGFAELGLSSSVLSAVEAAGFCEPTAVQKACAALGGRDALALAPTGSGKTLAYLLPLAEYKRRRTLVLTPTRELAQQVGASCDGLDLSNLVLTGGSLIQPQLNALLKNDKRVIVATPGRLLDLVRRCEGASLNDVDCLVVDEADRLLGSGFAEELAEVLQMTQSRSQTLLFSATFSKAALQAARRVLRRGEENLLCYGLDTFSDNDAPSNNNKPQIRERCVKVDPDKRLRLLVHLSKEHRWRRVLVFCNSKYGADHVAKKLNRLLLDSVACAFHGGLRQEERESALLGFRRGQTRFLVATDVAARGLDVEGLEAVINFDLPRSPEDYTHRVGRTGRANATGVAINFIQNSDEQHMRLIEKRANKQQRKTRILRETLPGDFHAPHFDGRKDSFSGGHDPSNGGVKSTTRLSKKDKLRAEAAAAAAAAKEAEIMAPLHCSRAPDPKI